MKRLVSLFLALMLILSWGLSLSEGEFIEQDDDDDDVEPTAEQMEELKALDDVDEADEEPRYVVGETWHEMELSEVDARTPAIYTCKITKANTAIYSEKVADPYSAEAKSKVVIRASSYGSRKAELLYVGSTWCIIRYNKKIGYIKRDKIEQVEPVDPVNTPPYGTQKSTYICRTADVCHVRKSMSDEDACWVVLNPGTMLSIWRIKDGWAVVPYWRTYGYIRMEELTDLIPVSPTDTPIRADTPIAAYTSFYSMSDSDINMNRLVNIDVACQRLTRVLEPGESFDFNRMVGPYRKSNGYKKAIVLINGVSTPGYGGGTCQVSSTLYNAVLQCPGISVLYRRPHGPSGAKYLPHGVDAAVGSPSLNLRFRNDYDFPIRIEGHTSYDGALLMVIYRVDRSAAASE